MHFRPSFVFDPAIIRIALLAMALQAVSLLHDVTCMGWDEKLRNIGWQRKPDVRLQKAYLSGVHKGGASRSSKGGEESRKHERNK